MTHPTTTVMLAGIVPEVARPTVAAWLTAEISAPLALLRLLLVMDEAAPVVACMGQVVEQMLTMFPPGSAPYHRAAEMRRLLHQQRAGLEQVSHLLRLERQHQTAWPADPVAGWAALFDAWVMASEEASVALYSLGDSALLAAATAEVVRLFEAWQLLGPDRVLLQIGCGIGRFEAALAGRVQAAYGIDISPAMLAVARRRCATLANVHLLRCSGQDLGLFRAAMFDVVYAVDTFPYLQAAGAALVARHFQEAGRVLKLGGDFVILNFSYQGTHERHCLEVAQLAQHSGFAVLENGVRPLQLWDGAAWRLRRLEEEGKPQTVRSG